MFQVSFPIRQALWYQFWQDEGRIRQGLGVPEQPTLAPKTGDGDWDALCLFGCDQLEVL